MVVQYRWNASGAAAGYDQAAQHIHPYYTEIQNVICDRLPYAKSDVFCLLDAGGGSGRLVERTLEEFDHAHATIIDQSESFLAIAERRLKRFGSRVEWHCISLQNDWTKVLSRPPNVIVSMSAIHHLDPEEKRQFYRQCFNALTLDGLLLNGDEIRDRDDRSYLADVERWARHMRLAMRKELIPPTMHEAILGWIDRNLNQFGRPKVSGDDCHETVEAQVGYLGESGFEQVGVVWRRSLWAVLHGTKSLAGSSRAER